jgi:predicted DNA-binding ribbon-helix-helix protein
VTSVSAEDAFWVALKDIALGQGADLLETRGRDGLTD